MHGRKPVQLLSRIAFVKQASNTTLLIQIQHQRMLLLPQSPMCEINFRDGWVMSSLMILRPVNPRHLQHSPWQTRRLLTLCVQKMMPHKRESDDEEERNPPPKLIKSTNEFLAIINQQEAYMKRNELPVKLVKQLKILIVGNQISLCRKQKEVTNYLKPF